MPDPRLTIRARALRAERESLRARLSAIEAELASIESAIADAAGQDELERIAVDVREYLGVSLLRRDGNRVNLRRRDERGDLLCIILASRIEQDGTWWTEIDKLKIHLETVKQELAREGRL